MKINQSQSISINKLSFNGTKSKYHTKPLLNAFDERKTTKEEDKKLLNQVSTLQLSEGDEIYKQENSFNERTELYLYTKNKQNKQTFIAEMHTAEPTKYEIMNWNNLKPEDIRKVYTCKDESTKDKDLYTKHHIGKDDLKDPEIRNDAFIAVKNMINIFESQK